jgi:hypothetical protein
MESCTTHYQRILAIDPRPQQFGYAIFEGPKRLLDRGACFFRRGGNDGAIAARMRVSKLSKVFLPSAIVVKRIGHNLSRNNPSIEVVLTAIRQEASARSIPVYLIARREVREAFRGFRCTNKYQIASILVSIFPELLWKLPPERKFYESEHPNMSVFDAIALGYTFWHCGDADVSPPE